MPPNKNSTINNDENNFISNTEPAGTILNKSLDSNPQRSKKSKIITAIAIAACSIIGIYFTFVAICGLYGDFEGLKRSLKPDPNPNSSTLVNLRSEAIDTINSQYSSINQNINPSSYYESSTHDKCVKGVHDWKVNDDYAHICSYQITKFYGFDGDFRSQMKEFEQLLLSNGWKSASKEKYPLNQALQEYYDNNSQQNIGYQVNDSENYLVSNIPMHAVSYVSSEHTLRINYTERLTDDLYEIERAQYLNSGGREIYETKEFQDIDKLFKTITSDNKYLIVLSISKNYYED